MHTSVGRGLFVVVALVAVAAGVAYASDAFGQGDLPHARVAGRVNAGYLGRETTFNFATASIGLLEQAGSALEGYASPVDENTVIVGDAMAGHTIRIGPRDSGLHFGGQVNGELQMFRLNPGTVAFGGFSGSSNNPFSLSVGAVGGAHYYVTDSVALFLQLHGAYSLLGIPGSTVRIEGSMRY